MKVIATNKKAYHNYFISNEIEAGIVLEGSEVKSVRNGNISIMESFISIKDDEVFLQNAYIKPYKQSSFFSPDSKKKRKLLLHKHEIEKLAKVTQQKGFTIIPLKVYIKDNYVKVQIGVGKGKKLYDKRESLKEKTIKRDMARKSYI